VWEQGQDGLYYLQVSLVFFSLVISSSIVFLYPSSTLCGDEASFHRTSLSFEEEIAKLLVISLC
jgi:hypothetical protein